MLQSRISEKKTSKLLLSEDTRTNGGTKNSSDTHGNIPKEGCYRGHNRHSYHVKMKQKQETRWDKEQDQIHEPREAH